MTVGEEVCHVYFHPCVGIWECVCMRMCVWCSSLTSHGKKKNKKNPKNRLICTSLHRISINLPAIYTPGTLITLVLQNSNNSARTSENKKKYCTQLFQEIQKHAFRVTHARSPLFSFHRPSMWAISRFPLFCPSPPDYVSITLNQSFPGRGNGFLKQGRLPILFQFPVSAPISISRLLHSRSPPQSELLLISSLISLAFPKERWSADVCPLFAVLA